MRQRINIPEGIDMRQQGGPFRVSIGAQAKYWAKLPAWRQRLQPFHVHLERTRGGITHNPTGWTRGYGRWK